MSYDSITFIQTIVIILFPYHSKLKATEEETLETGIAKGTLLKSRLNKSLNRNQSVLEYLSTNKNSKNVI